MNFHLNFSSFPGSLLSLFSGISDISVPSVSDILFDRSKEL
jgi:hypothetical protein